MRLSGLVILLLVAIVIFPAGVALAISWDPPANPVRALPDTVERGGTFNVTVNFTAPENQTNSVSLTDYAPDGWYVTGNETVCKPTATDINHVGKKADITWQSSYSNGTNFTGLYKVTVPCDANLTNYPFDDASWGSLRYYVGYCSTHFKEYITGDFNVTVVPPAICSNTSIEFYVANGTNPENKTLELWSSTPCWINWTLSYDAGWLDEAYPINGSCNSTEHSFVALSVNSSDRPIDDYFANITIEAPYPESNNSPRIVPVTLHVTDSGILQGQVEFCRKRSAGDPTWETPLVVRFFNATTQNETAWSPINVTTDAYGRFTIEDGIVPGTYDVGVKNWTSLSKMAYTKEFTVANIIPIDFGSVIEADTDNDDRVRAIDFDRVLTNYWLEPDDPSLDPELMYDLDRSGRIDAMDFDLVLTNYGEMGDIYIYVH